MCTCECMCLYVYVCVCACAANSSTFPMISYSNYLVARLSCFHIEGNRTGTSVKYSRRADVIDSRLGWDETGHEPARRENRNKLGNNVAGEATKKTTGLWQITVSICNTFSRISHGCYRRVER